MPWQRQVTQTSHSQFAVDDEWHWQNPNQVFEHGEQINLCQGPVTVERSCPNMFMSFHARKHMFTHYPLWFVIVALYRNSDKHKMGYWMNGDPEPLQIQPHRSLCLVCLHTLQAVQTSCRSLGVSICMDCPSLPHPWCNECQWFCLTVTKQSRTVMPRTYFAHRNCKTGRKDWFKLSKIQSHRIFHHFLKP